MSETTPQPLSPAAKTLIDAARSGYITLLSFGYTEVGTALANAVDGFVTAPASLVGERPQDQEKTIKVPHRVWDKIVKAVAPSESVGDAYWSHVETVANWVLIDSDALREYQDKDSEPPAPPVESHPERLEHEGRWYERIKCDAYEASKLLKDHDLIVFPNGQRNLRPDDLTDSSHNEGWISGVVAAGAALYREERQPPQPIVVEDPEHWSSVFVDADTGLRYVAVPQSAPEGVPFRVRLTEDHGIDVSARTWVVDEFGARDVTEERAAALSVYEEGTTNV